MTKTWRQTGLADKQDLQINKLKHVPPGGNTGGIVTSGTVLSVHKQVLNGGFEETKIFAGVTALYIRGF